MAKLYVVCDVPQQYVCVMGAEEYDAIDSAQRPRIHGEYETLTEAVAECDHVNAIARQQAPGFYARDAETGEWEAI